MPTPSEPTATELTSVSAATSTSRSTLPTLPNHLFSIPALKNNPSNFATWKYRIQSILKQRRLWTIVSGSDTKPDESDKTGLQAWMERDELATLQITLTLEDEPLNGVMHEATAKGVWDLLMGTYEGKGKQTIASLISDLFWSTLSDTEPLKPQLDAMLYKKHVLTGLGQALDDSLIAIAMVISLPPSYSTLCTILMSTQDTLTTQIVSTQVLEMEKSQKEAATHSAFIACTSAKGPFHKLWQS